MLDFTVPYEDKEAILDMYTRHGVVAVAGVLSDEEVEGCKAEVWRVMGAVEEDKGTWPWKEGEGLGGGKGFVDVEAPWEWEWVWRLREHPRILEVFRTLLKSDEIYSEMDRWGVLPPTLANPEWRTASSWLHWDQHPFHHRSEDLLQGLVTLTPHDETTGGFMCAPGFEFFEKFPEVCPAGGDIMSVPYMVPADHPAQAAARKVRIPKGALLVWNSKIAHQNYPNEGAAFRMVHYVTFKPIASLPDPQETRDAIARKLEAGFRGTYYPAKVTPQGHGTLLLTPPFPDPTPCAVEAFTALTQAREAEKASHYEQAANLYRKAFKLNPALEGVINDNV